jgi:hypothetical protein
MKNAKLIVIALAITLPSGCALQLVYENKYDAEKGWRRGFIYELGTGQALADKLPPECKKLPGASSTARFATIQYRQMNSPKWRTVVIPADAPLKVEDIVYFNVKSCKTPVIPKKKQ